MRYLFLFLLTIALAYETELPPPKAAVPATSPAPAAAPFPVQKGLFTTEKTDSTASQPGSHQAMFIHHQPPK